MPLSPDSAAPDQGARFGSRALALIALIALAICLTWPATSATAAPGPAATADEPKAETGDPLQVRLTRLTPQTLRGNRPIRVRGTIRNTSEQTWRAINLHALISPTPIDTDLAEALALPADAGVGSRITAEGTFDHLDRLEPGAQADFEMSIPYSALGITGAPGVYWFGVHALGETDDAPRDGFADGRVRTLLPLVDPDPKTSTTATLILPLQAGIDRDPQGRVNNLDRWATLLGEGGRLQQLLAASDSLEVPLTWLVDPAVLDAVEQIAQGNPANQLLATTEDPTEPTTDTSPSPAAADTETDPGAVDPTLVAQASEWLTQITDRLRGAEVLSLPYGAMDVSAAAQAHSRLVGTARARSAAAWEKWEITATPVLTGPQGWVRPEALQVEPDTLALVSAAAVEMGEQSASVVKVDGRTLVLTDTTTPIDDDSLTGLEMRQRILAGAALHHQAGQEAPLLMMLPDHWQPRQAATFQRGLSQSWITWQPVGVTSTQLPLTVEQKTLDYPRSAAQRELPARTFGAAGTALTRGRLVGRVVAGRSEIADRTERSVLTQLSTEQRERPEQARNNIVATRTELQSVLARISVEGPNRVILSSDSGQFSATLTNGLDVPVKVRLQGGSDTGLELSEPAALTLPPDSRRTVLLQARAEQTGLHLVTLSVTDARGSAIGSYAVVPVRAAQVSRIVWWLMLGGFGLLVVMSGRRLAQRWRGRAAGRPGEASQEAGDGD